MPLSETDLDNIKHAQTRFKAQLSAIRADPRLSEQGRRYEIAKVYDEYAARTRAIRDRADPADADVRGRIEPELFGPGRAATPAEMLAYRDAADRAEAAKGADHLGRLHDTAR